MTAWILVSLGLVCVALSLVVGLRVDGDLVRRAHDEAASRTQVAAVVLQDAAPLADTIDQGASLVAQVPVRYQDTDGVVRQGLASVDGTPRAGQTVRAWVDRQHQLVPAPTNPDDAMAAGWVAGGVMTAVTLALLVLAWFGIRHLTLLRNCAQWEREWELVEPGWSGRAGRLS